MPRWLIFPLLIKEIRSIKYLFQDKTAPKRYKLVVILGLIYLVSPIDLIPAPILGFSLIDDLVIWGFILNYLKEPLSKYSQRYDQEHGRASKKAGRAGGQTFKGAKTPYKGKTVVRDVTFTVVEDRDEPDGQNGPDGQDGSDDPKRSGASEENEEKRQ